MTQATPPSAVEIATEALNLLEQACSQPGATVDAAITLAMWSIHPPIAMNVLSLYAAIAVRATLRLAEAEGRTIPDVVGDWRKHAAGSIDNAEQMLRQLRETRGGEPT